MKIIHQDLNARQSNIIPKVKQLMNSFLLNTIVDIEKYITCEKICLWVSNQNTKQTESHYPDRENQRH